MSNIVSFAAVVNARRVATEVSRADTERDARYAKIKTELAEKLGGTESAHIMAEVATDLKRIEDCNRFMPAYCDPANERQGAKYQATKRLSLTEIATRMRQDVKEAIATGTLPKGLKVSVRTRYYSGGGSIDLRVTALPEGFRLLSPEFAAYLKVNPKERYCIDHLPFERSSPEYDPLLKALTAIHKAYNRDNSDAMTDYFDVNYYGDAGIDWELKRDLEAREIEAAEIEQ